MKKESVLNKAKSLLSKKKNQSTHPETPICDLLLPYNVYSSKAILPPPAEMLPHVIQFELSCGCAHNACTYCELYKKEKYQKKTLETFKEHVDQVWNALQIIAPERIKQLKRVFIGEGNALAALSAEELNLAVRYVIRTFREHVGTLPTRVAIYGNTNDILMQGHDLKKINCGGNCGRCSIDIFGSRIGLELIYWGIETGSTDLLHYINKGHTKNDVLRAANHINSVSNLRVSTMIMLGLGGTKYSEKHVEETIEVLNEVEPAFLTFMGTNDSPTSAYTRKMLLDKDNRPLTDKELVDQLIAIIDGLYFDTTLGYFNEGTHVDNLRNPGAFGSVEFDYFFKTGLIDTIKKNYEHSTGNVYA